MNDGTFKCCDIEWFDGDACLYCSTPIQIAVSLKDLWYINESLEKRMFDHGKDYEATLRNIHVQKVALRASNQFVDDNGLRL